MNSLLILLSIMAAPLAQAQDYTPVLENTSRAGRIQFKENLAGDIVFVPALLSQKFSCNPQNSVCTLQVFNQMNPEEEEAIRQFRNNGRNTLSLRSDLFRDWIRLDSEKLSGEINTIQTSFLTMKNLALLENAYGTSVFKAPGGDTTALMNRYQNDGIGTYTVSYDLKGVARDFSIRASAKAIEEFISNLSTSRYTFGEIKDLIKKQTSRFSIKGYASDDAAVIIAYQLKETFLKSTQSGLLRVDAKKWAQYKAEKHPYWLVSQTLRNGNEHCTVTLAIQSDAEMKQECEVEYEAE